MSCNIPYFQALLGVVKDTWAKPLVHNKYKNVTWFAYTACNEKHPKPHIDFEEHIIYVDCPDDLHHTYEKTQKAYNMIKDVIDFDYVLRTNTSVFVNVDKTIERICSTGVDDVMGRCTRYYHRNQEGGYDFVSYIVIGFFMGMKREYFDIMMSAHNEYNVNKYGEIIPSNDDVIMSMKLFEELGTINNVAINEGDICPAYKVYIPGSEPETIKELPKKDFFFEPDFINDYTMARVRSLYRDEDSNTMMRSTIGHEIEHMYELYNALK